MSVVGAQTRDFAHQNVALVVHEGASVEGVPRARLSGLYARYFKRLLDVALGLPLFVALLPVMLAVACVVRLTLGKGVLLRQRRVGLGGRPFALLKFRTMLPERRLREAGWDGPDRRTCHKSDNDPRHTSVGRQLRRLSLDELPQLWNVLRGDMSLVGPRPELLSVVCKYESWQHCRHVVRPGITGLWQVSARSDGLACKGVHIDLDYIDRLSFAHDCGILLRTIPVTFGGTGR